MSSAKSMLVAVAATTAALLIGSAAQAATQIIDMSGAPVAGNQPETGLDLGIDFTVTKDIKVYGLGAFTNGTSSIPVTLFSSTGSSLANALITGTPAEGSDYAFSDFTPIILTPGSYQIEATYNSGTNKNYNPWEPGGSNIVTFDTLGGALTFGGDYYNYPGVGGVANTLDTLSTNGYGAGTFLASPVPEPASWAMMLFGVGMIGAGVRMARRKNDMALTAA